MTFQARDRFRYEGTYWYIHDVRGEYPRTLSDEELGIESEPFANTALARGRIDTFGVEGEQLMFIGASAGFGGGGAHKPTPIYQTCEFFIGSGIVSSPPWQFDDYAERVILGFEKGILRKVTRVGGRKSPVELVTDEPTTGVQEVIEGSYRIAGFEVFPHEIDRVFDPHDLPFGRDRDGTSNLIDLARFPALDTVRLAHLSQVDDIRVLAQLPRLANLDLRGTGVTDLAPLRSCDQLATLDLRRTPVVDLSPIVQLPGLCSLSLSEDQLAHVSLVTQLRELRRQRPTIAIAIDSEPAPNPVSKLRFQIGYDNGARVVTPYADDTKLIDDRIPEFTGSHATVRSVIVRHLGPYVFWLSAQTEWNMVCFDAGQYARAVASPVDVPPLTIEDLARAVRLSAHSPVTMRRRRGDAGLPETTFLQCSANQLLLDHIADLELVTPPERYAVYEAEDSSTRVYVGTHRGAMCVYIPPVPCWLAGPRLHQLFVPAVLPAPWDTYLSNLP